jgi:6-phosphogluconolactonase (cycloisomerase 2 family)
MFGLASPTCSAVRRLCIAVANAAILLAAAGPAHAAPFLYVTQHDKKVSQYEIVAGGLLAPMDPPAVATDGEGMGVAVSPDGQSVYAVNYKGGSISQYDVGPGGALSPKSPAAVAAGQYPYTVTVSPDGHSVYANNQLLGLHMGPGQVWQYDVGPGGALSPKSPATVDAGDEPSDITVSPDSHSVYVPDMFDGYANFVVQQYDVGPGGALSPKSPATVDSGGGMPKAVAVSPDGNNVYAVNYTAHRTNDPPLFGDLGAVAQYDVGPGGELSPKSPATVATGEGANSVAVSPDGESVYVASNASSTGESGYVSQYDVGPGGALSPKGPAKVAAGSRAKSVTVSPDGQSVYVIDKYEGTISQYDVGAGGVLSPGTKTSVVTPDELAAGDWPEDMAVSPALGPTAKKQCKRGGWDRFGFKRSGGCIRSVKRDALHSCRKARDLIGRRHFRHRYGNPKRHHRRAMRRCVQSEIGTR